MSTRLEVLVLRPGLHGRKVCPDRLPDMVWSGLDCGLWSDIFGLLVRGSIAAECRVRLIEFRGSNENHAVGMNHEGWRFGISQDMSTILLALRCLRCFFCPHLSHSIDKVAVACSSTLR